MGDIVYEGRTMNPVAVSVIALVALVALSSYAICSINEDLDKFEDPMREVDDES
jgi:hypothetical protein